MLLTGFPLVLAFAAVLLAVCLSAAAAVFARRARRDVAQVALWVERNNKASVSLKRIAEVESTLTDLTDSYDSLLTAHKKLRSRIGMRDVRSRRKNADSENADLSTETDKIALRNKARAQGLLR